MKVYIYLNIEKKLPLTASLVSYEVNSLSHKLPGVHPGLQSVPDIIQQR